MTKKHHPHDRRERLKIKLEHSERQKKHDEGRVRRRLIKEQLKEKETEDDLRELGTERNS